MGKQEHVEEEELRELAGFVQESMNADVNDGVDPMIGYVRQLSCHFYTQNPREFRSRFVRGYKVLLEELNITE